MIPLEEFGKFRMQLMPNPFDLAKQSVLTVTNISLDPGEGFAPRVFFDGKIIYAISSSELPQPKYPIDLARDVIKPELIDISEFDKISMVAAKVLNIRGVGGNKELKLDFGREFGIHSLVLKCLMPDLDLEDKSLIAVTNIEKFDDSSDRFPIIGFFDFSGFYNPLIASSYVPPGSRFGFSF